MNAALNVIREISPIFEENTYLVYDPASRVAALVDPGYPLEAIDAFIARESLSVRDIVLTHGHVDHISGVGYYRNKYGATVWLSADERDVVEQTKRDYERQVPELSDFAVDRTFEDGESIGALGFRVVAAPGHTKGSAILELPGLAFTGDTLFEASVGRTDLYSGDEESLKASLRRFMAETDDDVVIAPGHGSATRVGRERQANPYVLAWTKGERWNPSED